MADTKGSALTALAALSTDDLFLVVDDPGGTPVTKNITVAAISATAADQEAGTSAIAFVTPAQQHRHPSAAKFWAVVTIAGGTHSLATSFNVTSITDGATGIHTVTIATDFSSANWACVAMGEGAGTAVTNAKVASASSKAAGTVDIATYDESATPVIEDANSVSTVGFGDQ